MRLSALIRPFFLSVLLLGILGDMAAAGQTQTPDSLAAAPGGRERVDQQRLDEAYELLYQNSENSQDRLVSTIQWSVGLFLAIIAAVIGSHIFFNYRINKEEVDRIEAALDGKVSALRAELFKTVSDKHAAGLASLQAEVDEKVKAVSAGLEKANRISQIETEVAVKVQENELKRLKADIEKNDARLWLIEGVKGNALSAFVRSASLQLELGYELKYSLADVVKTLDSMDRLSDHDVSSLRRLLRDLPDKYAAQKKRIEAGMEGKPVYRLGENNMFGIPMPSLFGNLYIPFPKSDEDA